MRFARHWLVVTALAGFGKAFPYESYEIKPVILAVSSLRQAQGRAEDPRSIPFASNDQVVGILRSEDFVHFAAYLQNDNSVLWCITEINNEFSLGKAISCIEQFIA